LVEEDFFCLRKFSRFPENGTKHKNNSHEKKVCHHFREKYRRKFSIRIKIENPGKNENREKSTIFSENHQNPIGFLNDRFSSDFHDFRSDFFFGGNLRFFFVGDFFAIPFGKN